MFARLRSQEIKEFRELANEHEAMSLRYKSMHKDKEQAEELLKANHWLDLASNDGKTDAGRCSKVEQVNSAVAANIGLLAESKIRAQHQSFIDNSITILADAFVLLDRCPEMKNKPDFNRLVAETHGNAGFIYKAAHNYAEAERHFGLAIEALTRLSASEMVDSDKDNLALYQEKHLKAARSHYKSQHGFFTTIKNYGVNGCPVNKLSDPVPVPKSVSAVLPAVSPAAVVVEKVEESATVSAPVPK